MVRIGECSTKQRKAIAALSAKMSSSDANQNRRKWTMPNPGKKNPNYKLPKAAEKHKFQKGNKVGVGRASTALAPVLREIRRLSQTELALVGEAICKMTVPQIELMATQPDAPALHRMVGAICQRVLKNGDAIAFDKLMDRLVGKVKEKVEHSGNIGQRIIINIPSNGREAPAIDAESHRIENGTEVADDAMNESKS
jgi:hypothetical protein